MTHAGAPIADYNTPGRGPEDAPAKETDLMNSALSRLATASVLALMLAAPALTQAWAQDAAPAAEAPAAETPAVTPETVVATVGARTFSTVSGSCCS